MDVTVVAFLILTNWSDTKIVKDKSKLISPSKNYYSHRVQSMCEIFT
jgi:hypothetical protein